MGRTRGGFFSAPRSKECRFDKSMLTEHKLKSMRQSHRFLVDFFADSVCFENATSRFEKNWNQDILFEMEKLERDMKLGNVTLLEKKTPVPKLIIGKRRLYELYKAWNKEEGLRNVVKKNTFLEDLDSVGVIGCLKAMRCRIHNARPNVVFLTPDRVRKGLGLFYSVRNEDIGLKWFFEEKSEFEIVKTAAANGVWRFRRQDSDGNWTKKNT